VTTIKAACPGCGEIDLVADDILLRIGASSNANTYGFSCPDCGDFIEKRADERVIRLLLSGGVMPVPLHIPAEALEIHTGPPLTFDDLIDFHHQLADDTWLTRLTGS
jgi:predicted RNA-binding Zn-ribbon protein involved in translation (DUF1610 family)